MKSITAITALFAALWTIQASAVPRDQVLHKLLCRGFSSDWAITVYQDSQFGLVQMSGEELINGVDANIGFGFPVQMSAQPSGFTVVSDLVNSDGSQDTFSIDAQTGHLIVQNLVYRQTNAPAGTLDLLMTCSPLN